MFPEIKMDAIYERVGGDQRRAIRVKLHRGTIIADAGLTISLQLKGIFQPGKKLCFHRRSVH